MAARMNKAKRELHARAERAERKLVEAVVKWLAPRAWYPGLPAEFDQEVRAVAKRVGLVVARTDIEPETSSVLLAGGARFNWAIGYPLDVRKRLA